VDSIFLRVSFSLPFFVSQTNKKNLPDPSSVTAAIDDDQLRLLALGIEAVAKLEIHRGAADLSSGASVLETLTGRLDARVLTTLFEDR